MIVNQVMDSDEEIPLSQYRFSQHLAKERSSSSCEAVKTNKLAKSLALQKSNHNAAAFAAPPAPEDSSTSSIMKDLPNPFPLLRSISTEVKVENEPCAKFYGPLGLKGLMRPVCCDTCGEYWHLKCANMALPPRYGSWGCPRCK